LACGSTVSGDTSDFNSGATEQIDSYPVAVGNYDGAEIAYSFVAPHDGVVSLQLVDAQPMVVDHDLFLLSGDLGCTAEAALERGHNSLSFMAQAGESYYFVVDGYDGDQGAFEIAVECGPSSDSPASTPDPATYGECLFGWTSQHLKNAPHLLVAETGRFASAASVPPLLGQQLVQGIQQDGWAPGVSTVEQVFEFIDPDGLYVNSVIDSLTGDRFTWAKFYAGDTEVGYLYRVGTLDMVAIVSDGDVIDCTVSGPSAATPGGSGGSSSGGTPGTLTGHEITWIENMDVSGWPVTSNLASVTLSGGQICMDYDMRDVWPSTFVGANNVEVVANAWVIAEHNGQWYGKTWEWMRPGQTCKTSSSVNGAHTGAWPFAPGESFQPTPGVTYYFMVSTPARFGSIMTIAERTNLVPIVWN